jgi:hypothetical protein
MSATSAAFGMRPAYHPSGLDRAQALANGIASGYNANILKGQPVKINVATGAIVPAAAAEAFVGCFAGVEFTDTTGRRRVSNYWPANTSATEIVAYFYTDPAIVYEIQTNATLAQTAIGQEYDLASTTAGSTTTGLSQCVLATTAAATTASKQMRVIDIAPYPDNAWGDNFVIVRAQIAQHQFGGIYNTSGVVYPVTIA